MTCEKSRLKWGLAVGVTVTLSNLHFLSQPLLKWGLAEGVTCLRLDFGRQGWNWIWMSRKPVPDIDLRLVSSERVTHLHLVTAVKAETWKWFFWMPSMENESGVTCLRFDFGRQAETGIELVESLSLTSIRDEYLPEGWPAYVLNSAGKAEIREDSFESGQWKTNLRWLKSGLICNHVKLIELNLSLIREGLCGRDCGYEQTVFNWIVVKWKIGSEYLRPRLVRRGDKTVLRARPEFWGFSLCRKPSRETKLVESLSWTLIQDEYLPKRWLKHEKGKIYHYPFLLKWVSTGTPSAKRWPGCASWNDHYSKVLKAGRPWEYLGCAPR